MPVVFRCSSCGYELYRWDGPRKDDYYGLPSAEEVANMFRKCPKCGRTLSKKPLQIKVM